MVVDTVLLVEAGTVILVRATENSFDKNLHISDFLEVASGVLAEEVRGF